MNDTRVFLRLALVGATVAAFTACKSPGSNNSPMSPSTPGMYTMAVNKGLDGKLPGTAYSGPATFGPALGGTLIVLWTDSSQTTRLVSLFRQAPVTAAGTYKPFSLAQSVVKPDETPTAFVVGEHFTDATAFLGGDIRITAVSDTSLTATMNYDDGVHTVDASFNAIRQ